MDHCVFIHSNPKQIVGAIVAQHALRRNSRSADKFDVKIITTEDHPFFAEYEGKTYLRDGVKRVWLNDDLQSFTPLRFMPPELMGYRGRAVIIDPDIFAVGDIWELLSRDMQGKSIIARARSGTKGLIDHCMASSVMLLDCAKLTHWQCEAQFRSMFEMKLDYSDWICLKHEDRATIGLLENEWNDFDRLTAKTKMLHTTRRKTQPWKSGLPVDWRPAERFRLFPPIGWLMRARRTAVRRIRVPRQLQRTSRRESATLVLRSAARVHRSEARHRRHAARRDAAQPRAPRRIRSARPHARARPPGSSAARAAGSNVSSSARDALHRPRQIVRRLRRRRHLAARSGRYRCNRRIRPASQQRRWMRPRRGAYEPGRSTSPDDAPAVSSETPRMHRGRVGKVEQVHRLSGCARLRQHRHAVSGHDEFDRRTQADRETDSVRATAIGKRTAAL